MGFFCYLKYNICDIFCRVRAKRWRFVFCCIVSLVGFALGVALFCVSYSRFGWWYYNRCNFASKLATAGFSVLISYVLTTTLVYILFVLSAMLRQTHYLCILINLVVCFYCGATLAATFVYSALWGVLYAVFVAIPWLIIMCFSCFICLCEPPVCRNFIESNRDLKPLAFVLTLGLIYKIFALFVILKVITVLI